MGDPMRVIVNVKKDGPCDWLRLLCGHELAKEARIKWGRKTSCKQCGKEDQNDDAG